MMITDAFGHRRVAVAILALLTLNAVCLAASVSEDLVKSSSDNSCKSVDIVVAGFGSRLESRDVSPLAAQIQFVILLEKPIQDLPKESVANVHYDAKSGRLKINVGPSRSAKDGTLSFESSASCENGIVLIRRTTRGGSGESPQYRVDATASLNANQKDLRVAVSRKFGISSKFEQSQDIRYSEYSFPVHVND